MPLLTGRPLRPFIACLAIGAGLVLPQAMRGQSPSPDPTEPARLPSSRVDPLDELLDQAIASGARRYLDGEQHSPWQIMHGVLAIRRDYQIRQDGQKINALEWIARGPRYEGRPWFQKTSVGGRAHPYTRNYIFEGHPNQFLAILTMSDLPLHFKLATPDGDITIADMVQNAKWEVNTRDEPTWTLWALSHYLDPDAVWDNKYNQRWSLAALVRQQVNETFERAACGGTHAGFALGRALDKYRQTGRPLTGAWLEADQKVSRYIQTVRAYQNSDGSLSTSYFQNRAHSADFATRLQTSGHTLEFVVTALPVERLNEPWVRKAVETLASEIYERRRESVDVGALFHAVDALVIYRDRTRAAARPAEQLAGESAPSEVAPAAGEAPARESAPAADAP